MKVVLSSCSVSGLSGIVEGEVRASVEGGVYVNEIDLTGKLGQQTWQNVLLIPRLGGSATRFPGRQQRDQETVAVLAHSR